jgi:uncharacterized protein (DUF1778 family)
MILRISLEKEKLIEKACQREGKSKTAFILEAIDEKLGISKKREQIIREMAGWLSHEETQELRRNVAIFNHINEGNWD